MSARLALVLTSICLLQPSWAAGGMKLQGSTFDELRQLAKAGDADAQFRLAVAYATGDGCARESARAMQWLQAAAEQEHEDASFLIAISFECGTGVVQDHEKANRWLERAANQGHPCAQSLLGQRLMPILATIDVAEKNPAEAAKWYRKAAEQGEKSAKRALSKLETEDGQDRGGSFSIDDASCTTPYHLRDETLAWLMAAGEQGNASALFYLARLFHHGLGVERDLSAAVRWYKEADRAGHPYAGKMVTMLYVWGNDFCREDPQLFRHVRSAAEQGDPYAQAVMGRITTGRESVSWLQKAATQGDIQAQCWLGACYYSGRGVPQDFANAALWYRRAAEQDDYRGQGQLGTLYALGHGVPQDLIQAHMWLNLAVANDPSFSRISSRIDAPPPESRFRELRDDVASRLTPDELVEAQRLAREWRPKTHANINGPEAEAAGVDDPALVTRPEGVESTR